MRFTKSAHRSATALFSRRIQRGLAAICCTLLLLATSGTAAAHVPVEPTTIAVDPATPRLNNAVQITLSGAWADACVPQYETHRMVADAAPRDTIIITLATPSDAVCGQVVTDWSIAVDMGRLPTGQYEVTLTGAVQASHTFQVHELQFFLPTVAR